MSLTDPTKDVSWILYETKQKTLLRPSHLRDLLNTKSSSLTKQTTPVMMYNSYYGRILRHFIATADLSSPVITRTKSSNPSTPDVPLLTSPSKESKKRSWQDPSSSVYKTSWMKRVSNTIKKSLQNLYQSTSQIFVASSTNANGILQEAKLTQQFLHLSQISQ